MMKKTFVTVAFLALSLAACGEPQQDKVIDNSPPANSQVEPAPTDRDPTPQRGSGGQSQSTDPNGLEKTE